MTRSFNPIPSIKNAGRELLDAPAHNKIGLGIGVTSLGLSINNYRSNKAREGQAAKTVAIENKSLQALEKIHKALVNKNE